MPFLKAQLGQEPQHLFVTEEQKSDVVIEEYRHRVEQHRDQHQKQPLISRWQLQIWSPERRAQDDAWHQAEYVVEPERDVRIFKNIQSVPHGSAWQQG